MLPISQLKRNAWFWCLFPALTMALGWMLRGYIGGGSLGAMIPGAMVGLGLCLLLDRSRDTALITAFAAVGVGFGGQETYGQTVGLVFQPETYSWGILGFFIKGGTWGLLGGSVIGIALTRRSYRNQDLIAAFALMVAGTYAGWKLLNEPRLIYFSNPIDRPRQELWFGLLLGTVVMLLYLTWRASATIPWRFALWGALGGSIGFASGAAAHAWIHHNAPDFPLGGWKFMEMTFGFLLGLGIGIGAWRNRHEIADQPEPCPRAPTLSAIAWAALAIAIALLLPPVLKARLDYTIAGALLLTIALYSESFSWQTAITATYCAFAVDLLRHCPACPPAVMWTFVVITTIAVAVTAARTPRVRSLFLLMIWSSTMISLLKALPALVERSKPVVVMEVLFLVFAALLTWLAPAGSHLDSPRTEQVPES